MTAFIVITYAAFVWLILWAIQNMRRDSRARREASTWLAGHQREVRGRQLRDEAEGSEQQVGWRKG